MNHTSNYRSIALFAAAVVGGLFAAYFIYTSQSPRTPDLRVAPPDTRVEDGSSPSVGHPKSSVQASPPAAPRAPAAAPRRPEPGKTPPAVPGIESTLIARGDSLNMVNVGPMLKSKDFLKAIQDLAQASRDNPLASDLTELFTESIQERFASDPEKLHLHALSCGTKLCIASIDSSDNEAWRRTSNAILNDKNARIYAFIEYAVGNSDGTVEKRVIFSTDPSTTGINEPITTVD